MLDFILDSLSPHVGASADELKLLLSFLLSYPLAGLLKRIPDKRPDLKNAFIIATSTFYLVGLFSLWDGVQTLVISAGGIYVIAGVMKTSHLMPWLGFAFLMAHLSVNHITRQVANSPSLIDITGAQMVLVMKLSAFCWNVADGQLPVEQLSDLQRDRMLPQLPGLVDYLGYVLFFPSLFAGPAFDYAEYRRWLDTTMFDVGVQVEASRRPPVRKKRKIPRSGTPATWKALGGLGWLGLFVILGPKYPYDSLRSPSFMAHGFLRRVLIMYLVNFTARLKYYAVWTLTEGACILAGLGFNGVDATTGRVSWNRLQNVNPWGVETAQNPRGYLGNWNMNTNNWLRNYVYLRVTPRGKKPGFRASFLTFGTSALWHGFYPGYYLSFVLASLLQTVAKNFRRSVRPLFLDAATASPLARKKWYDVTSLVATQLIFSFITTPFLLLSLSDSLGAWARVYFFGVLAVVVPFGLFASPVGHSLRAKVEQRHARAGARMVRTASQDSVTAREPILGLSADPERDISDIVNELRADSKMKGQ